MNEHDQFRLIESLSNAIRIVYHGRSKVQCPHCEQNMILPVLPLSPVVVCQCENCQGFVVPFAGQLLGLPRGVVEGGSDPDIRWAIEQAIMKMLHSGVKQLLRYKVTTEESSRIPNSFDDLERMWSSNDADS